MSIVDNLNNICKNLEKYSRKNVNVIAVSKTFPLNTIRPLINLGHLHFGENRVKEAVDKWSEELLFNNSIQLHLIGNLQSNKAKDAVKLFSYIHSLDTEKLAYKLNCEQKKAKKYLKYFIQVNFENEPQKCGISEKEVPDFLNFCRIENELNVIGLMCIPPLHGPNDFYFKKLKLLADENNLSELSMGMSSDYVEAIKLGATYIRIGSLIFGTRK